MKISASMVGTKLPTSTLQYNEQDVILYALGVGATAQDLPFVFERDLRVLPTFGVIPELPTLMGLGGVLEFNPMMLVHGEQRISLNGPIPTSGTLTTAGEITGIFDKGDVGALVVVEAVTTDESGSVLFKNTFSALLRGEGNFGGERGPSSKGKNAPPDRSPDHTVEYQTSPGQAALYRLSGDRNPLHIDSEFAKRAGFDRPILHGLCTFGFVGRAILQECCEGDPTRLKDFEVRFSDVVFPGEVIATDIWEESPGRIIVQTTSERGAKVISNAAATIAA